MEDQVNLVRDTPEDEETPDKKAWFPYIPKRYILTAMLFLGTANSFALRVNFNVAMVAMVNDTEDTEVNSTVKQCEGPSNFGNKTEKSGHFLWSPGMQSLLLGSYYYGYPILQPLSGYLACRYGPRWLLASTGITAGILNLLQPVVASWNPYALIVLRTLLGLGQGPLWPAMATMVANWTPDKERARLFAIANSGLFIGTVVSQSISGVLCDTDFLGGWPSAFYVFGVLSLIWSAVFLLLTSNTPSTHPTISKEEKELILSHVGDTKYRPPPWKDIFTSRAFYAFWFMLFMDITAYDILFTFLPLYMKRVLKYDIAQSGGLASLPYLTSFLITFVAGYSSDVVRNKGWLSTMWIRRVYTIAGECLPAMTVLVISTLGCDRVATVICFITAVSLTGLSNGGFNVNLLDIGPKYAGAMYGFANGFSNTGGFIGPLIVGAFTSVSANIDSWKAVFYLVAAFYVLGTVVFCIFGSADLQPWADPSKEDPEEIQESKDDTESTDSVRGSVY